MYSLDFREHGRVVGLEKIVTGSEIHHPVLCFFVVRFVFRSNL